VRVSATVDIRLTCEVGCELDGGADELFFMAKDGEESAFIDLHRLLADKDVRRAAEEALRDAAVDLRESKRAQARGGDE